MFKVLLLFILLPVIELALLLEIGRHFGTIPTLALIVLTGVLGGYLARREGLGVLRRIQADVKAGRLPGAAVVDGVIILIAGAVLITPGVLTDVAGFLCLVPATRRLIRASLWSALTRAVRQGRAGVHVTFEESRWPEEGRWGEEGRSRGPHIGESDSDR